MLTFKITSLKYFVKITKWIFLESTRKGLLKNVQDRISMQFAGHPVSTNPDTEFKMVRGRTIKLCNSNERKLGNKERF